MGILSRWQRAREIWKEAGTAQMIASLFQKASLGFIECGAVRFFVRDLDRELAPERPLIDFQLRLASVEDIRLLVREGDPSQASEEMLRDRFEREDLCFIAESSTGELVHSRWVASERGFVPELGMEVLLKPAEAYMYGGYTPPRWRKAGVDAAVRSQIFLAIRAWGGSRLYSYVRGDSPPALRAARRLQILLGSAWYLRIGRNGPLLKSTLRPGQPLLRKIATSASIEGERPLRLQHSGEWFSRWLQQSGISGHKDSRKHHRARPAT